MEEVWTRAYKRCIENVDQYIEDATTLKNSGSYGHAFALAVIAQEEVSKALGYIIIGLIRETEEGKTISKEWLEEIHTDHEKKITLALLSGPIEQAITDGVAAAEKELRILIKKAKEGTSQSELTREILSRYASPQINEVKEREKPATKSAEELQDLKEKGLYVDADINGKVVTPLEITEKEVNQEFNHLKNYRHRAEWLTQIILTKPQLVSVIVPQAIELLKKSSIGDK